MAVACFNKLSFNTQTATLFATEELLYRKIIMGAAQTRNPLKRVDLNFGSMSIVGVIRKMK